MPNWTLNTGLTPQTFKLWVPAKISTCVCSYRLWDVPCPGSACRSYRCRSPERVWSSTCTPPHRWPLPHTRSQTDPEGEKHFSAGSTSRQLRPTVTGCCVFTFLMSWTQRRPHPRESVLKISTWLYWRLVNAWLRQRSPAGQTCRLERLESVSGASKYSGRSVMEGFPYLGVAFIQQHAVDALGLHPTGALICCFAVTAWDLWQVGRKDLNLSYWSIHLQRLHT